MITARYLSKHQRRARRGSLLTDVSLGLGILGLMVVLYLNLNNTEQRRLMAVQAGTHLRAVAEQAYAYMLANFSTLETAAAGGPIVVSMPTVLASGGFSGLTANSPINGHQLCLVVTRPAAKKLEGMVISTGGTALSLKDLSEVRKAGGFLAGEIDGGVIRSTRSAWTYSAALFSATGCVPTDGHFAYALSVPGTQVAGTALSRVRIPGLPEANHASEHVTLQRTCDDPTTVGVETGADCSIRADGQASNEPGLDRRRIQMLNSLIGRSAVQGMSCDPSAATYSLDAAGLPLICSASGSWQTVPSDSDTVNFW